MPIQSWVQTLVDAQVDGPAYANSVVANTPLQPTVAGYTFPANFFDVIGKALRVTASGRISISGAALTLNIGFALGTLATPIIVFAGGANTLVATAKTNVTWALQIDLTLRAIGTGTSANFMGIGTISSEACLGSAAGVSTTMMLPLTAPAVGTGFDSTLTQYAQLVATWGTASASNTITCHQYKLESMN
jgi:hypothetical protein